MQQHLRLPRFAALLVVLTSVGCGTTVHGEPPPGSSGAQSLAVPGTTEPGPTVGGSGASSDNGVGASEDGSSSGNALEPSAGSSDGATVRSGADTSRGTTRRDARGHLQGVGITPTQVYIGVGYTSDGDATNAAIGATGFTQGDPLGETKAVIKDINDHGGVAGGRKLVPVFHGYSGTSGASPASQDQAACADYTQDHKVFAVADKGLTDNLPACLNRAGVLEDYSGDIISHDDAFYRSVPHFMDLGTLSQDRMMAGEVASLVRQHYFTGWNTATGSAGPGKAKVGVLATDDPNELRPLRSILLPALARAGYPVSSPDVVIAHQATTTADTGREAAEVQAAGLRFRHDNVTHVIVLDPNGVLTLFFSRNAETQGYFPRYGVNSGTGMQILVKAGDVDARTLRGAVGLGWLPLFDLPAAAAAHYQTPASRHCLSVMRRASFTFSDANAEAIGLSTCDAIYFLAYVIDRAVPSITLASAQRIVDGLGTSFPTAFEPRSYFAAGHHAGAYLGYDLRWDSGCGCTRYSGKPHPLR